ncbi:MAG: lytic murein transglycosylase [Candidatus Paceibacterota bacterium]
MAKKIIICLLFVVFLFPVFMDRVVLAVPDCLHITPESSEVDKSYCRGELAAIEAELVKLLDLQKAQKKQTGTLIGDVNYLNSQINALRAKIQARSLVIAQLKVNITEKTNTINSLSQKIAREHESLAKLLRNTHEFDNENIVYLVLSDASLSNFYNDLESYASIKQAVQDSVDVIKGAKTQTEIAKQDLEKKQNAETDAKVELENAQRKVAVSEAEKKKLLSISKDTEVAYQKLAAEKKARADKIRAALFPLRDAGAIPFGTALMYAENAEKITGVRPAFVLAILQQESNMGANVGSCVIANLMTGETRGVNSGTIFPNGIHPTRDLPLLQTIVTELGRNPLITRVSCPIGSGYGGAMGPTQFIPSTWNGMKSRVAAALNKTTPDPWNPQDAIMASSLYLKELGANAGGYTAERTAALKYYAGGNWSKPSNAFYGDQVMGRVTAIQANIDLLQ